MRHALVLHNVNLDDRYLDVAVTEGRIVQIAARLPPGDQVIDARGGALLPGLWDHHLHLLAMAAAAGSVDVGSATVDGPKSLQTVLRNAHRRLPTGTWLRAVGYHESASGPLDREILDDIVGERPVRVQHRSGAMWVLNTVACRGVGLEDPSGLVLGDDAWLRSRLPPDGPPDLAPVGRALAAYGITGVTDMTPSDDHTSWELLAEACSTGALPQRVVVSGGPALTNAVPPAPLIAGPVKLYLADHALPDLDELTAQVVAAHDAGRAVAFHSVTRASLVLAIAALEDADAAPGDRIEHGAIVPPELADSIARIGASVVTQPGFIAERGDYYLDEVDEHDRQHLYPCDRLLRRGIGVGGSTDAPFGPPDPWQAIAAATDRRALSGRPVGTDRPIGAASALALFLGTHTQPGGPIRQIEPGVAADLCILSEPLTAVLAAPARAEVQTTVIGGAVAYLSDRAAGGAA